MVLFSVRARRKSTSKPPIYGLSTASPSKIVITFSTTTCHAQTVPGSGCHHAQSAPRSPISASHSTRLTSSLHCTRHTSHECPVTALCEENLQLTVGCSSDVSEPSNSSNTIPSTAKRLDMGPRSFCSCYNNHAISTWPAVRQQPSYSIGPQRTNRYPASPSSRASWRQ